MDRDLLRGIGVMCASVGMIGISYGATAVAAGFPLWLPALTGFLVLAASSEFLFVGVIAAGGDPFAGALAGLLVNVRHIPYGLAVPDVIEGGWRRIVGTHLLNDETVVLALSQDTLPRKRAAYLLCGLGIAAVWPVCALAGGVLGALVHDTDALGLDAMFPAVILALILPALRDRSTARAALVGGGVAMATFAFLPVGLPELLALVGVLAAGNLKRGTGSGTRMVESPADTRAVATSTTGSEPMATSEQPA